MVIALDIDEVLADLLVDLLKFYNRKFDLNIKPENFKTYNVWEELGLSIESMTKIWEEYLAIGGFRNTPTVGGAVEYLPLLAAKNELYAITGRSQNLHKDTEYWLDKYFPGLFSKIYYLSPTIYAPPTKTKFEVCKEIGARVLIDDMTEHGNDCALNGIKFILFDKPWNRESKPLPNIIRVHSWPEIIAAVEKIANS